MALRRLNKVFAVQEKNIRNSLGVSPLRKGQ